MAILVRYAKRNIDGNNCQLCVGKVDPENNTRLLPDEELYVVEFKPESTNGGVHVRLCGKCLTELYSEVTFFFSGPTW